MVSLILSDGTVFPGTSALSCMSTLACLPCHAGNGTFEECSYSSRQVRLTVGMGPCVRERV